jgi:hypothetical protein
MEKNDFGDDDLIKVVPALLEKTATQTPDPNAKERLNKETVDQKIKIRRK